MVGWCGSHLGNALDRAAMPLPISNALHYCSKVSKSSQHPSMPSSTLIANTERSGVLKLRSKVVWGPDAYASRKRKRDRYSVQLAEHCGTPLHLRTAPFQPPAPASPLFLINCRYCIPSSIGPIGITPCAKASRATIIRWT